MTTCLHPLPRQYTWTARDDTVESGCVLCVACGECGAVLSIKALPVIKPVEAAQRGKELAR